MLSMHKENKRDLVSDDCLYFPVNWSCGTSGNIYLHLTMRRFWISENSPHRWWANQKGMTQSITQIDKHFSPACWSAALFQFHSNWRELFAPAPPAFLPAFPGSAWHLVGPNQCRWHQHHHYCHYPHHRQCHRHSSSSALQSKFPPAIITMG